MNNRTAAQISKNAIEAIPPQTIRVPAALTSEAEEVVSCTLFPFLKAVFGKDRKDLQKFPSIFSKAIFQLFVGDVEVAGSENLGNTVMKAQWIILFCLVVCKTISTRDCCERGKTDGEQKQSKHDDYKSGLNLVMQ
ncbi:hypothetical protein [Pelagovum sp. HNIBRBA483]|uniref:hypothetical protein n=1 Tax=Pelagovum sp. HNIBRBA483 TaxID=3233341 RepID=UPI0034A284F6